MTQSIACTLITKMNIRELIPQYNDQKPIGQPDWVVAIEMRASELLTPVSPEIVEYLQLDENNLTLWAIIKHYEYQFIGSQNVTKQMDKHLSDTAFAHNFGQQLPRGTQPDYYYAIRAHRPPAATSID